MSKPTRYLGLLVLAISLSCATQAWSQADDNTRTAVLTASEDGYLLGDMPHQNFGAATELHLGDDQPHRGLQEPLIDNRWRGGDDSATTKPPPKRRHTMPSKTPMTPLGGKNKGILRYKTDAGHTRFRVVFTTVDAGKRRFIRRTCKSLSEAQRCLADLRAQHQLGALPPRPSEKMRLAEFMEIMVEHKRHIRTWADSHRYLREIVDLFGPNLLVEAIDERRIAAYRDHLAVQKKTGTHQGVLGNQSKDHRLKELPQLLKLAHRKGIIRMVPEIRLFRNYGKRQCSLTRENFPAFLEHMPGPPLPLAILTMGLVTGMRKTDLLTVRWDQLISDGCEFRALRYFSSKNGKELCIPIHPILRDAIEQLIPFRNRGNPHMFPNPRTGRPYKDLRKHLDRASEELGIKPSVTLHMVRHLAADGIMEATGSREITQAYMGWSSLAMVDTDTHTFSKAGKVALDWSEIIAERLAQKQPKEQ